MAAATTRGRGRRRTLGTALCAGVLLAGCSGDGSSLDVRVPGAARAEAALGQRALQQERPCPARGRRPCDEGPVTGSRQVARLFAPSLRYRLPAGWVVVEDLPGHITVGPPGADPAAVDAGRADFVGVYKAMVPAQVALRQGCNLDAAVPLPGDWSSPDVVAAWFRGHRDLSVSRPAAVTLGGLAGVVLDVRADRAGPMDRCIVAGRRARLGGIFTAVSLAPPRRAVRAGVTTRLYLLESGGRVLAVQLHDAHGHPVRLPRLARVARSFRFVP